jgi:hypothetical protein
MYTSPRIMYRNLIIIGTLLGIAGCGVSTLHGGASGGSAASSTRASSSSPAPSGSRAPSSTQPPFSNPTSAPSTAALTCASHEEPITADSLTITLTCTVTGAESDETSFTVDYTVMGRGDQARTSLAVCSGPVSNGRGTCMVTFGAQALDALSVEVMGELLPSHRSLGPETPTRAP